MSILPRVIRCLFPVPVIQLHIGPKLNKQPDDLKVARACSVEQASLAVSVLVVDIAAGSKQSLADPSVAVELSSVEEWGLAEEVIIVEWKVEGEKIPDNLFLLVSTCEVQDSLFVEVLMPNVSALLHQIIQSFEASLLVTDLNGSEEHIFPLMIDTLNELSGPWIADYHSADVIAPVLIDHLPEQMHHLLWLTHITYIAYISLQYISESSAIPRTADGPTPAFVHQPAGSIPASFPCSCG